MHMVRHQTVGVNLKTVLLALFFKQIKIDLSIVINEKHILPIIAPLRRMMRLARDHYPCNSSHAHTLTQNKPTAQNKW
jgi:hypothetical protein